MESLSKNGDIFNNFAEGTFMIFWDNILRNHKDWHHNDVHCWDFIRTESIFSKNQLDNNWTPEFLFRKILYIYIFLS